MSYLRIKYAVIVFALGVAAAHASDVDVGVTIAGEIEPGVYGRVRIGNNPPPPVVYSQPVIVMPPRHRTVVAEPVYMHVPPGHAKKWSKHCHKYNACGESVYFVRTNEYESDHWHDKENKHKYKDEYKHKHKHKHHDDD